MFDPFLVCLRAQGLPVGLSEWLAFLSGLGSGLATDVDGLYLFGRAVLCRTEADYDAYDNAFSVVFREAVLPHDIRGEVLEWLEKAVADDKRARVGHDFEDEELVRELLRRLAEQTEAHNGGKYWVGTGGASPFGHSGRAQSGIRVGGSGGGRRAIQVASERRWANYRSDRVLDVRDLQVVLRALRSLVRDGPVALDIDETIATTARNGGEIELVELPDKKNQLRVVLLMDAGGSMAPHAEKVERLFSAASAVKTFRSFEALYFHNCVYGHLYRDIEKRDKTPTATVLASLTSKHRLIFVGDASMAPYELLSVWGWPGAEKLTGLEWLRRFRARCPASVWLNPDPLRWWRHPTVESIGGVFPMHELTVEGVAMAVRRLRSLS